MSNLKIVSVNCQGLGDPGKRRDVLNFLKSKKCNIYCLQDTHFKKDLEPYIQPQWGFQCVFSSYSSNSRGTAIMINNNFQYEIHNVTANPYAIF